jgi:hypothetical protein
MDGEWTGLGCSGAEQAEPVTEFDCPRSIETSAGTVGREGHTSRAIQDNWADAYGLARSNRWVVAFLSPKLAAL